MAEVSEAAELASIQYVVQLARTKGPEAIRKLVKLLDSYDEKIQLAAANAILDRGFGKPVQDGSLKVDGKIVVEVVKFASADSK